MRWVMHVQRRDMCTGFLWGGWQEKRDCLEDFGTDGRIALKEILQKHDRQRLQSSGLGETQEAGSCQHSKEPSVSMNMWETS
jgi:hypothetical protein